MWNNSIKKNLVMEIEIRLRTRVNNRNTVNFFFFFYITREEKVQLCTKTILKGHIETKEGVPE